MKVNYIYWFSFLCLVKIYGVVWGLKVVIEEVDYMDKKEESLKIIYIYICWNVICFIYILFIV